MCLFISPLPDSSFHVVLRQVLVGSWMGLVSDSTLMALHECLAAQITLLLIVQTFLMPKDVQNQECLAILASH